MILAHRRVNSTTIRLFSKIFVFFIFFFLNDYFLYFQKNFWIIYPQSFSHILKHSVSGTSAPPGVNISFSSNSSSIIQTHHRNFKQIVNLSPTIKKVAFHHKKDSVFLETSSTILPYRSISRAYRKGLSTKPKKIYLTGNSLIQNCKKKKLHQWNKLTIILTIINLNYLY